MPRKGKNRGEPSSNETYAYAFLQKTLVACARARRKLADSLTSILKGVTEMIDNNGLRPEALYVSKLGYAKIIPTSEQKISTAG